MDPSNECATPGSDGRGSSSSSDGNGGRSANTSSRRRRFMPSSPTGTQLISEFNAAGDAGGSGSSSSPSSSGALDLEGVLLLATPVATDSTIIMEGELLDDDNEPGTTSSTRRSASLVDNNGLGTSSNPRRSTFVDNNGPRNRVDLDLVLVSSGSQGSNRGGSGGRRSASNDQFTTQREEHRGMQAPRRIYREVGSSSRQPAPGAGQRQGVRRPPNIQMHPHQGPPGFGFPHPYDFPPAPGFCAPPPPPPWVVPGFPGEHVYLPQYAPEPSIYVPLPIEVVPARQTSGLYPPPGVTIRHPLTSNGDPPPPEQPGRTKVTITAPPGREGPRQPEQPGRTKVTITAPPGREGPRQPEKTVPSRVTIKAPPVGEGSSSSPPKQPEATPPVAKPEQPVPTFQWPPTAEEDALITETLYGPCRRPRLPIFEDICPSSSCETSPPPSLPPPPTSSPPPPPGSP